MTLVTGTLYIPGDLKIKSATGIAILSSPIVSNSVTYNPTSLPFTVVNGEITGLDLVPNVDSSNPQSFYSLLVFVGNETVAIKVRVPNQNSVNVLDCVVLDEDYEAWDYLLADDPVYSQITEDTTGSGVPDILEQVGKIADFPRSSLGGPSATFNGVNGLFYTGLPYVPGSMRVFYNGVLNLAGYGLVETSPELGSFTLTVPPTTDDTVDLKYSKEI